MPGRLTWPTKSSKITTEREKNVGRVNTNLAETIEEFVQSLLKREKIDAQSLARARGVQEVTSDRLDLALVHLGLVSEREMAELYSDFLNIRLTLASEFPNKIPALAEKLPSRFLRATRVIPIERDSQTLVLSCADPFNTFVISAISVAIGMSVIVEVAVPIDIDEVLKRLYPDELSVASNSSDEVVIPFDDDAERLRDLVSEAPVIKLVNQIISRAVETGASDIHLEPAENKLRIRYRYDGALIEVEGPPPTFSTAIISRLKLLSRLDIAERRLPQDGRVRLAVRGTEVDFRASTVPSLHGESLVLRVLNRDVIKLNFSSLGISPNIVRSLEDALRIPNGMILVTGPTGSGKTTTLYTGLLSINSIARKIFTVEDPIEYELAGITQIQARPQIGLTFASLLRAILRQDPDVIMVGEIRDVETAQISIRAALTGHLVLSTLHTNSSAAAINRLRDMGVEDYLLSGALRGVMAQRLVRRLCSLCKEEELALPSLIERFPSLALRSGSALKLSRPVGCAACKGTGYQGRLAIAEFLPINGAIRRLIADRADEATIQKTASAFGMVTMFDGGLDAVVNGFTSIEEILHAVSDGE